MNSVAISGLTAAGNGGTDLGDRLARMVAEDGSAGHAHLARLLMPGVAQRDLADAIHTLCAAHCERPGIVDGAATHAAQPGAARWLDDAGEGFAAERVYLARLTAAAGPIPSTPGHAESESAVVAQRHAFDMLARSDRTGCATGGVAALLLDWLTIRPMLDTAALRVGIDPPPVALPDAAITQALIGKLADTKAIERAILFGAEQLLLQHRGLWDLIEARAEARDHS